MNEAELVSDIKPQALGEILHSVDQINPLTIGLGSCCCSCSCSAAVFVSEN